MRGANTQITGGIDYIDNEKKIKINELINFIKQGSGKTPGTPNDEEGLNKLLQDMDTNLTNCTSEGRYFNEDTRILEYINSDYINHIPFKNYIFSQLAQDEIVVVHEDFEVIGCTYFQPSPPHFIAYVKYNTNDKDQWWKMDTLNPQRIKIDSQKINNILYSPFSSQHGDKPRRSTCLYRNKNIPLKTGTPPILEHFDNVCYLAAPLQLLMATYLLDDKVPVKQPAPAPAQPAQTKNLAPVKVRTQPAKVKVQAQLASVKVQAQPAQQQKQVNPQPQDKKPTAQDPTKTSYADIVKKTKPVLTKSDNNNYTITYQNKSININVSIGDILEKKADAIVNPANIQLNNAGGLALKIKTTLYNNRTDAEYLDNISKKIQKNKLIFKTGDAIITSIGNNIQSIGNNIQSIDNNIQSFKYVIHTPGPDFNISPGFEAESYGNNQDAGFDKIKDCMFNILNEADKNEKVKDIVNGTFIKEPILNQITSISIPMISTSVFAGVFNTTNKMNKLYYAVGQKYMEGIIEYLQNISRLNLITHIKQLNFVIFKDYKEDTNYFNNFIEGFTKSIDTSNKPRTQPTQKPTAQSVQTQTKQARDQEDRTQEAQELAEDSQLNISQPSNIQDAQEKVQPAQAQTQKDQEETSDQAQQLVTRIINLNKNMKNMNNANDIFNELSQIHNDVDILRKGTLLHKEYDKNYEEIMSYYIDLIKQNQTQTQPVQFDDKKRWI